MAKKFTSNMQPPTFGQKIGLKSPILEAYSTSQNSTRGIITDYTDMGANSFDRCVVNFRGRSIRATCCHPGMTIGSSVCMIEQPRGIWYATILQKSWYSRPLVELSNKGHVVQAAVEWLLSFGAKWQPRLIFIDKRGEERTPYAPPVLGPGFVVGYTETTWPYDPEYFDDADKNGDGFVDEFELIEWFAGGGGTDLRTDGDGAWMEFIVINGRVAQVRWTARKIAGLWYYTHQITGASATKPRYLDGALYFRRPDGTTFSTTWPAFGATSSSLPPTSAETAKYTVYISDLRNYTNSMWIKYPWFPEVFFNPTSAPDYDVVLYSV